MTVAPIFQRQAFKFIETWHRHHQKPVGSIFQIAAVEGTSIVGVAVVGRPVARMIQDGFTCEVTRLCTTGEKNACSMLYSACARAARELGYKRIITYILSSETGTSLKATGWTRVGEVGGGSWSRSSREREDKHPLEKKILYEKIL